MTEFVVPFIRHPMQRERQPFETEGDSLTHQSFREECDIKTIMSKYQKNGLLDHVNQYKGEYGDVIAVDFHEAMTMVTEAQQMFESLPSSIRTRFGNDPGSFLEYATNPENKKGMQELGLLPPSQPEPEAGGGGSPEPAPPEGLDD